jgi:hypothetical protein
MTTTEARNALIDVEIEEAFQAEQWTGFTQTNELPCQAFTWALDWAFERDEHENPLAEQMKLWEQNELRKIREEDKRSSGLSHVDVGGGDVHLNVNRTWEELTQVMCERSSGPNHVVDGGCVAQEAYESIRISVRILEELEGRPSEEVIALRRVNQMFRPFVHTA